MSQPSGTLEPEIQAGAIRSQLSVDGMPLEGLRFDPLPVIQSMAREPNRSAAIERLAGAVAAATSGDGVVRVIWGSDKKIRRIFDRHLGSLGTESSLWHEIAAHWHRLASGPQTMIRTDGHCIVRLPEPAGQGRALLWITCPPRPYAFIEGVEQAAPAIAAVLWSRPAIAVPQPWRQHHRLGSWVAAAIALMVAVALVPVPYRVPCTARVEPVRQRVVAAPFEATLLESRVQPGDAVAVGELLVVLDGRPLQLELEALQADRERARKQHDAALATGRIAEAQLADLEHRQLQRRIDLLEQRLVGLEVRSPIDGVVVSGDLRKAIGSPLEMGKPLLEIAPLDQMTIEIDVPERDIHYVGTGAAVRVRLSSAGTQAIDGRLQTLYPAAEVRDERNVFVGQWEVENRDGSLRPGMRGTAAVYGPRRPLVWPLIRRLTESLLRVVGW